MLNNFHLAAISKQRKGSHVVQRIRLTKPLQDSLATTWSQLYDEFTTDIEQVSFQSGYTLEGNERFVIPDFPLPDWLTPLTRQIHADIQHLKNVPEDLGAICGIVAVTNHQGVDNLLLFQNFTKSRVLSPDHTMFFDRFLDNGTYKKSEDYALILGSRLNAIYNPIAKDLLFDNYRSVNTFLPLFDYHREASDNEIREILRHSSVAPENIDKVIGEADQWTRKRFTMMKDSCILDRFTVSTIISRACEYEQQIHSAGDKLVFPEDKKALKSLLRFLCEEVFRGPISGSLFETNSKKVLT